MEPFIDKVFSVAYIAIFLIVAFGLMILVGKISNYLIRKILGIGG